MILNYVADQWQESASNRTFEKLSPFNGEVLTKVTSSDAMDFVACAQHAKKVLNIPVRPAMEERAVFLKRIAELIQEREVDIATREATHQGMSVNFILQQSVRPAIQAFLAAADDASWKLAHPTQDSFLPTGLVVLLPSHGLSFRFTCEKLAPAIAAGNSIIVKASQDSPITGQILGEVLAKIRPEFPESIWPTGSVQVLQGLDEELLSIASSHPAVRAVTFCGNLQTAEKILANSAPTWKKLQLHTDYNNPCLILADTDPQVFAKKILDSCFTGQGCLPSNISRIFVLESQLESWKEAFGSELDKIKMNQSIKDDGFWGPMIHRQSAEIYQQQIQKIKTEGGKILFGGEIPNQSGFYLTPTISLDLSNCSTLRLECLHLPLILLSSVKYPHDMIKWANNNFFGQVATVFGPEDKAKAIASKLEFGEVWTNGWLEKSRRLPTGVKQSFYGVNDDRSFGAFFSDCKKIV